MSDESSPGARLRSLRQAAKLSQPKAAAALGVDPGTLSRYELGKMRVPADVLVKAEQLWSDTPSRPGVEQPGARVAEVDRGHDGPATELPRVMGGLPYEIRVWLQQELLDYAKAGVSDGELRSARDLFERPEVSTFYAHGVPKARTDDEVLRGLKAIATAVRHRLRERGYKLELDTPF